MDCGVPYRDCVFCMPAVYENSNEVCKNTLIVPLPHQVELDTALGGPWQEGYYYD